MVKHILFFCVFVWTCVFAFGEENKLYGPDGKLASYTKHVGLQVKVTTVVARIGYASG